MRIKTDIPTFATPKLLEELAAGQGIGMAEAASALPAGRSGKTVCRACVWRWATRGIHLANGRVLKLESARVGNRPITSRAAIRRFIAAQNVVVDPATESTSSPTPAPTPEPTGKPTRKPRAATAGQVAKQKLDLAGI